jgi:hypothetical protein
MRTAYKGTFYRRLRLADSQRAGSYQVVSLKTATSQTATKKCTTYSSLHHLSSSSEFKLKYRTARNNTAREEQHQHKIPADGKPAKMTKAKFAMSLQLNAQRELKITMTGECH